MVLVNANVEFAGKRANLAVLGYFKYAGFFAECFNTLTGSALAVPRIVLPIGISFYTFQSMSYVIDV